MVSLKQAQVATDCLESPDPESSDKSNEGRRIERVPGGWMVLNATRYQALATRAMVQEQTRTRVRRHRERKQAGNAPVTVGNEKLTPSDTDTDTDIKKDSSRFAQFWDAYPKKKAKGDAEKAFKALKVSEIMLEIMLAAIALQRMSTDWTKDRGQFIPHPATWLRAKRWDDEVRCDAATARATGPTYADDGWFEECQALHGGKCNGSLGHRSQMRIDAMKREAVA
jgi:hypothetical protein